MIDVDIRTRHQRPRLVAALGLAAALLVASCGDQAEGTGAEDGASDGSQIDGSGEGRAAGGSGGSGGSTTSGSTAEAAADEATEAPPAEPWDELELSLVPVASLAEPTALAARPGSEDLWVLERSGRVRVVERTIESDTEQLKLLIEPVLDISDQVGTAGEGGLLGLAFSLDGGLLYLHYTDVDGDTVVSEVEVAETTADPASERVLLQVDQPFSNHNGGDLAIGPDGYLYIGLGDGGSADDPQGNGQNTATLLGTILRIDPAPSGGDQYSIPDDNPFAGSNEGRPEIWLWGARNPWRFSFDAATGDLWIGDVGQNAIEEIDLLPASSGAGQGANLGWNLMEGDEPFAGDPPSDHVGPIHTYRHEDGRCSVTGGYVYRGSAVPGLEGVYLYADYCTGEVWGLAAAGGDGAVEVALLALDRRPGNVISFGEGPDGELYLLEGDGRVSRIQLAGSGDGVVIVADS
jgi:glucose/arabinose dehydrogenase